MSWSYPSLFKIKHNLNSTSVYTNCWCPDSVTMCMHRIYAQLHKPCPEPGLRPGPGRERCCFEMLETLSNVNCPPTFPVSSPRWILPAMPGRGHVPVATQTRPKVPSSVKLQFWIWSLGWVTQYTEQFFIFGHSHTVCLRYPIVNF